MAKTNPINVANPAGSSAPRLGDDYIRALALAVVEVLKVDHYMGATSPYTEDAAGQHAKVKFQAGTSATTVASQTLFAKLDVAGLPLAYKDFSGTVCVLTSGTAVLLNGAELSHGSAINTSGNQALATACPAASGSYLILASGTSLVAASDPMSGSMAVATTKYVDDQITANEFSGDALTGGIVAASALSASTASWQKTFTHGGGLIEIMGYAKSGGGSGYTQDVTLTGLTGVLHAEVRDYSTEDNYARRLCIGGLTNTTLTVRNGHLWSAGYILGFFYRVIGYHTA
jgi:hypothetical protein